jgi:serine/threonine-protein kinase
VRQLATLQISASGTNLTIWVDGKAQGAPPVTLNDLVVGEHEIRVEGERFEVLTETVTLQPGETKQLGPLRPKVKVGSLTVEPGTDSDGAEVRLDGKRLSKLPVTLDLDNSKPHQLIATKAGFDRFEQTISFDDGKAETVVHVALVDAYTETAEDEAEDAEPQAQSAKRRTSNGAMATLTMNSIPPAKILLDGKPIGQTPRIGLSTKPGVHSVTFVHPERGRKTVRVSLAPGQNRTVSVRF